MKTIFFILAFTSTALAGGGNLSDGLSPAVADSLYVNIAGDTMTGDLTAPNVYGTHLYSNGVEVSTGGVTDSTRVLKTGDIMTGALQVTTVTVTGNAFSVGGSTLNVASGKVGVGTDSSETMLDVNGTAQFGSGTTKSTFTATGTLQMGNRTQAIGYLPVFASSASLGAESIDITTSKICVSTMAAATLFGGRPLDMVGHVNVSVSGAAATVTKTIELNEVVIETDVIDFAVTSTGALVPLFHYNTSVAGSNTFRVCMTKTGAGTVTVTDFRWRVAEW